jgi:hypothetical protein
MLVSKKLPNSAGPAVHWAQQQWTLALTEPSRKAKTKALRELVITQAMEIDKLRAEAKELEEAYDAAETKWSTKGDTDAG